MKRNELLRTICLISLIIVVTVGSALLLNLVTGPKIKADAEYREELKKQQAAGELLEVLPGAVAFEEITTQITITDSAVSKVYKETSDKGYAFIASKKGPTDMKDVVTVTVGVDMEGKVTKIIEKFANPADYKVNANTINSFVGQDSALGGIVLTTGATVSSNAIKSAVEAGLLTLINNDLIKAGVKTDAQIIEELLSTVFKGFAKDKDYTDTVENMLSTFKHADDAGFAYIKVIDEVHYLIITNNMNVAKVYTLNDEKTELVDVTVENEVLVTEALTHSNAALNDYDSTAISKFTSLMEATEVEAIDVEGFNNVVSAVEITTADNTYYGFYVVTTFKYGTFEMFIVLDTEGKIVKTNVSEFILGTDHYDYHVTMPNGYFTSFDGLDVNTFDPNSTLVSGATYSSGIVKDSINYAYEIFANIPQGGNE